MKINHISLLKAVKSLFALMILTLFIQGCGGGGDSKSLSPVSREDTILAFGDSLTIGTPGVVADSYPSVLAELSGRTVINEGIKGETTAQGLNRLTGVINDTNPYLMILLEGGNDILRGLSLVEAKENLSSMIGIAEGKGVQVVLLGVPTLNLSKLSLVTAPLYQELSDEHPSVVYDGELLKNLLKQSAYRSSDNVHLNKAGYKQMALDVHQLLIDEGALNTEEAVTE